MMMTIMKSHVAAQLRAAVSPVRRAVLDLRFWVAPTTMMTMMNRNLGEAFHGARVTCKTMSLRTEVPEEACARPFWVAAAMMMMPVLFQP